MKRHLLAGLALALCSSSALAADLYSSKDGATAPVSGSAWSGFYLGAETAYGWDATTSIGDSSNVGYVLAGRAEPSGWLVGVHGGYNFTLPNTVLPALPSIGNITPMPGVTGTPIVIGVELATSLTDIADVARTQFVSSSGPVTTTGTLNTHVDWLTTASARAGVLALGGSVLVYGTGGPAMGGVSNDAVAAGGSAGKDAVRFGYSVGGGMEYALSPAWTFKTEYRYIDLGSGNFSGSIGGNPTGVRVNNAFDVITSGVSLHF